METIRICDQQIPVSPQRHARVRRLISGLDLQTLMSKNYGVESYRLLSTLVPTLPEAIPLWQWEGYGSPEAMESDDYKEADDRSPTTDEIAMAFETVLKVNGVGRLGKIMNVVQTVQSMSDQGRQAMGATDPTSPGSPGASGA